MCLSLYNGMVQWYGTMVWYNREPLLQGSQIHYKVQPSVDKTTLIERQNRIVVYYVYNIQRILYKTLFNYITYFLYLKCSINE